YSSTPRLSDALPISGMQRLVDGPFPAWMVTASIAATILTIIPVATVGLNHHMTMQGYFPLLRYSPTLRFTVFGAISYTVFSVVRSEEHTSELQSREK